jgi:hypothetical protein
MALIQETVSTRASVSTNQYVFRALIMVATVFTSLSVCLVFRSADFKACQTIRAL